MQINEMLYTKTEKIEVILCRMNSHSNKYKCGWRTIGNEKYKWPIPFNRTQSWTGKNKALKEFFELVETSKHPKINFK